MAKIPKKKEKYVCVSSDGASQPFLGLCVDVQACSQNLFVQLYFWLFQRFCKFSLFFFCDFTAPVAGSGVTPILAEKLVVRRYDD